MFGIKVPGPLVLFAASALMVGACADSGSNSNSNGLLPVAPPAIGTYPASAGEAQSWVDNRDDFMIRAHAWDVWASITASVGESDTPVWETWYSGNEIFVSDPNKGRSLFPDFENPVQFFHAGKAQSLAAGSVTSVNRYSPALGDAIWARGLNSSERLDAINETFNELDTPVINRAISTSEGLVDAALIALKPVFQIVDPNEPTAIPYWAGSAPSATTNTANPTPDTWKQCVVIDPSESLLPGEFVEMPCNGVTDLLEVVSWESFYSFRLTKKQAKDFGENAQNPGGDLGSDNQTSLNALEEMVKPGNMVLLVAMHVATKEIASWAWQTFWWGGPAALSVGSDLRPDVVKGVWRNYDMRAAYYMVESPDDLESAPHIAFNPYLETGLSGTFTREDGIVVDWTGVTSNCMTCHSLAGWQKNEDPNQNCFSFDNDSCGPPYRNSGFIDPASDYIFGGYTKLDFLWSLQARPE